MPTSKWNLVQLSFLMLFVELTIIRWAGAHIYALSYFSNFILLASFLGIGVGFIRSTNAKPIFYYSPFYLSIFIVLSYIFSYQYQIQMDNKTDDLNFYSAYFKANLIPIELTLPFIFIAVTIVMASIADGVARVFKLFAPLEAYRLEISGSLLGVICFALFSWAQLPPFWWGITIFIAYVPLLWLMRKPNLIFQLMMLVVMLGTFYQESFNNGHFWSPYYKIFTLDYSHQRKAVIVNGWPQQFVESVAQRQHYKPFYFKPYAHLPSDISLNNVLIVGAGTGGDVAIALAEGAKHVDAVEIDPKLFHLGDIINPDKAYQNPNVSIYINDGRAFLQNSKTQYDLVIFALPDSLMVLSGLSSIRLENYLFTVEGLNTVYRHLTANGVFAMYNYYRERWMIDRLANTLVTSFQHSPCLDTEGEKNHWLSVLTISKNPSFLQCNSIWQNDSEAKFTQPTTDNYPFLYVKEKSLSGFYITALLFIFLTSIYALRFSGSSLNAVKRYPDLFLMGTAFLLLESKSVTTFALLFGSTWFVNALVFIGVLMSVFLSIEVTHRTKTRNNLVLLMLLISILALAWLIPNNLLLTYSFIFRFIAASTLTFGPIFIANLIFANRFRETASSTQAFGANMLGAVLGGLLEYASIIVGYQNLILIVASLYLLAILAMKHQFFADQNVSYSPAE